MPNDDRSTANKCTTIKCNWPEDDSGHSQEKEPSPTSPCKSTSVYFETGSCRKPNRNCVLRVDVVLMGQALLETTLLRCQNNRKLIPPSQYRNLSRSRKKSSPKRLSNEKRQFAIQLSDRQRVDRERRGRCFPLVETWVVHMARHSRIYICRRSLQRIPSWRLLLAGTSLALYFCLLLNKNIENSTVLPSPFAISFALFIEMRLISITKTVSCA
jgi:hypothetical protein